jgi:alpha-glucosidase
MALSPYFASIHHDGSSRYVSLADPQLGDELTLRLRLAPEVQVERILLRTSPDGEQAYTEMQPESQVPGAPCRWWRANLRLNMPVTHYRFLLFTAEGVWWYNGSGLHEHIPTDAEDFRLLADFAAPTWVRTSVFYQIFPDRFYDGDVASNVKSGEFEYYGIKALARRWGVSPTQQGRQAMVEFYGGDLQGITAKLYYLADLGINALYLNPIFTAYSNHRYDVCDYYNVDPHLGGNPALAELRQALAAQGMHYILDIVPNHCGVLHPWFQEARADPDAPTADFFTFHKRPDDYATWLGVRTLPKLNYRSQKLRETIYSGEDAVFRHWLRPPYAADGWRIDVANMLARQGPDQLGIEVGRGIRQAVKEENPQAYLIGENFFDPTGQLQGDILDAVMNYSGFSLPVWYWVNRPGTYFNNQHISSTRRWSAQTLAETWQSFRAAIPWVVARQQFNLLNSHDTGRLHFITGGNKGLYRMAAALLFTYLGVPSVYYGEEIGLQAENSLSSRQCMPWEQSTWDMELHADYHALVRLRKTSPALIEGGFQVLLAEEDTLAYLRDSDQEFLVTVAHRGPDDHPAFELPVRNGAVPDGIEFTELFSGQRVRVGNGHLPLPVLRPGAQIWQAKL